MEKNGGGESLYSVIMTARAPTPHTFNASTQGEEGEGKHGDTDL